MRKSPFYFSSVVKSLTPAYNARHNPPRVPTAPRTIWASETDKIAKNLEKVSQKRFTSKCEYAIIVP